MIERAASFLSSLRLTVVCLCLALVLVFTGTLAEVHLGLYAVQQQFFRSFFVWWKPAGGRLNFPVFPGGWLIGLVLLVNLLAAHIKRFKFSRGKIGILLVHAGLIFLLLGQFLTEILQTESQMRLEVGQSSNYSEDSRRNELVVIDTTNPDRDDVTAIPQSALAEGGELRPAGLPFSLHVKRYLPDALPAGPMSGAGEKLKAANGLGQRLLFTAAPPARGMDDERRPAALVEVVSDKGAVGNWTVSTWLTRHPWSTVLQQQFGDLLGTRIDGPQGFSLAGRTYEIALRPVRYYKSCTITLVKFNHDTYAGTDIPSNFSSRVHLSDPARGEDRDVVIRMNSPLRYRGEAFYQASFEPGDRVSILQVVHNPAAVTPYAACGMMALGLVVQFLTHLLGFAKKRARASLSVKPPVAKNPALFAAHALAVGRSDA